MLEVKTCTLCGETRKILSSNFSNKSKLVKGVEVFIGDEKAYSILNEFHNEGAFIYLFTSIEGKYNLCHSCKMTVSSILRKNVFLQKFIFDVKKIFEDEGLIEDTSVDEVYYKTERMMNIKKEYDEKEKDVLKTLFLQKKLNSINREVMKQYD